MKKLFYIVLLVVILLVIGYFVKNNNKTNDINGVNVDDVVTISVDDEGNFSQQEDMIISGEGSDVAIDSIAQEVEEDIVEENPDLTAEDGETIINE